jgi:hypothetical protein
VYARYLEGKKSSEGVDLELLKMRMQISLESSVALAAGL